MTATTSSTRGVIQPFKWQVGMYFTGRSYNRMDPPGWRIFSFYCLKVHTMPEEGHAMKPEHYHGFWVRFLYWLPFDRA